MSDCFFQNGEAIYGAMRNGGMRSILDMANSGIELPLPPPEIDGGIHDQFDAMGINLPGLDQQARGRLGRIVWWIQYPFLISHTRSDDPIKVIPSIVATRTVAAPPAATTSSPCHISDRRPNCENCGGAIGKNTNSGGTCVGVRQSF